ncbi:MAG: hypothetical protein DRG78_11145, partial [Epsilonproteobacteria bacterium]
MHNNINILDKVKGYFSPHAAFETAKLRNATALISTDLYDASKNSPHYKISITGTTEEDDIYDLETLRNTSRDKYKNNGFYKGIIQVATDHTISSGLRAKSTINRRLIPNLSEEAAKNYEAIFDDYFNSWAESNICDVTAKDNFYSLQRLAYKVFKKDGDSFTSLPLTKVGGSKVIQVDLIGAENIASNDRAFVEGIKLSKNKMPLQYSIKQQDNTYKIVRAFSGGKRNVLHIFERERTKIARGIPFLTPVMRDIDAIDQYMKYEMTAAKLAAIFFGSITTEAKENVFGNDVDLLNGDGVKETPKNTITENSITQLAPGDKLDIAQKGRDNPNFDKFVLTSLQKVAATTRIPTEITLAHFTSSYSASRAAMLQMQKFVEPERMLFNNSFNKPIREQVIIWGVLQGDIPAPADFFENKAAYLKCMWLGSPIGSVDPLRDANAKVKMIDNFLLTREKATSD